MSAETFILTNAGAAVRFIGFLRSLRFDKPWKVTIQRIEPGARVDQEAVLRGKERRIADYTGHDAEEVHDMMLARHFGTETVDLGNGKQLVRPARRTRSGSNPLNESEMRQHMRFVETFGATELGLDMR